MRHAGQTCNGCSEIAGQGDFAGEFDLHFLAVANINQQGEFAVAFLAAFHHRADAVDSLFVFHDDGQFGGIRDRGTDVAVAYLRFFNAWPKAKRFSNSDLFVDAMSAFYSVLRASPA